MEKFLFNDGTNVIQELHSAEELKSLLRSCSDPSRTRIWEFDSNEWISYTDFAKKYSFSFLPSPDLKRKEVAPLADGDETETPGWKRKVKRFSFVILIIAAALLIYNFTHIKWESAGVISRMASRPANMPDVNVDSLIQVIEMQRGQSLDKVTRTNFRIRNSWPDKISLKLTGDKFSNKVTNKFENLKLTIDNSTGYNLNNAIVQLNTWKKVSPDHFEISNTDTVRFSNIGYVLPAIRNVERSYQGDSLSASFYSIKSKGFNFCYSSEKQSNYGNINDRWYCKD
ncbi:MAG: hypothetical protein JST10_10690 [Bacteroidetes bacterium]|nr:hypothetical protein [Bacteroidota bacterium]MBS1633025.1 hypothetical protein [Bacteroidota bacterium]